MAIWLGKQYLGQTDKIESKSEVKLPILNINVKDTTDMEKEFSKYDE